MAEPREVTPELAMDLPDPPALANANTFTTDEDVISQDVKIQNFALHIAMEASRYVYTVDEACKLARTISVLVQERRRIMNRKLGAAETNKNPFMNTLD